MYSLLCGLRVLFEHGLAPSYLHGLAPSYLADFCRPVSSVSGRASLRSLDRGDLYVPRVRTKTFGNRSFSFTGPSEWNALPTKLRDKLLSLLTFKARLKTHLFSTLSL